MWEGAAAHYERLLSLLTKELSLFFPLDAVKGIQHGDVMLIGYEPPGKIANFEGQVRRFPPAVGSFSRSATGGRLLDPPVGARAVRLIVPRSAHG